MMSDKAKTVANAREAEIVAFLDRHGLGGFEQHPLPGDASTRSYLRLIRQGQAPLMLMNAPPVEATPCPAAATPSERIALGYNAMARLAASRVDAFAACAGFLRAQGLSAPEVVAFDADLGLAVTEDLGDALFARQIEQGADPKPLYETAIDALIGLHRVTPPSTLEHNWPLLTYDDLALRTGADLLLEWWPKFDPMVSIDAAVASDWEALWGPVRKRAEAMASVFTHRDYHAENLIWLPERGGAARVGMIDFQDAVLAHPAWDLLSLLQDARRDVDPALEALCLDRYLAAFPDQDPVAFRADYAFLAVLNASRILGLFARLIIRDGKPRYEAFMPRMWGYIIRNLETPGLEDLRDWFEAVVPDRVGA
jgi:aminoglycoside/choline kinase family phosphotransferase